MKTIIDCFNDVVAETADNNDGVAYVNLRRDTSNELTNRNYKEHWRDELHPTNRGFLRIARGFDKALRDLHGAA